MGNKQVESLQRRGGYPFKVMLVQVDVKIQLQKIKFQQSVYNIEQQKFKPKPFMDKEVRNSQFCMIDCPKLQYKSRTIIRRYLVDCKMFECQYDQINTIWRMTRYNQGGHFAEHCDRQKQLQNYMHFGTQIFLPPKNLVNYEGGQLILIQNQQQSQIKASQNLWTHIILPLGIRHKVNKVKKGFRISYVKQIWIKQNQKQIQTDQDKKIRQQQQFQRLEEQRLFRQRMILEDQEFLTRFRNRRRNLPPGYKD